MAGRITPEHEQLLAEVEALLPQIRQLFAEIGPDGVEKAAILVRHLNGNPQELRELVDCLSRVLRASPGWERLAPHIGTLIEMAKVVEAEKVMWARAERWKQRLGIIGWLAAGALAALAWAKGAIVWPPS